MTVELAKLSEAFQPEYVGKLPRIICGDCSRTKGAKCCAQHKKSSCKVCGNYVTEKHIHLDYVGHADVTARLLSVDPAWSWEPVAFDSDGMPKLDVDDHGNPVGMWIKLTVGGVTRLGYGSCPSDQSDAVKVLIGDALRNAAMRFGVALDLWAKGDRADPMAENAVDKPAKASRARQAKPAETASEPPADDPGAVRAEIGRLCKAQGWDIMQIAERFAGGYGSTITNAEAAVLKVFLAELQEEAEKAAA